MRITARPGWKKVLALLSSFAAIAFLVAWIFSIDGSLTADNAFDMIHEGMSDLQVSTIVECVNASNGFHIYEGRGESSGRRGYQVHRRGKLLPSTWIFVALSDDLIVQKKEIQRPTPGKVFGYWFECLIGAF